MEQSKVPFPNVNYYIYSPMEYLSNDYTHAHSNFRDKTYSSLKLLFLHHLCIFVIGAIKHGDQTLSHVEKDPVRYRKTFVSSTNSTSNCELLITFSLVFKCSNYFLHKSRIVNTALLHSL